MPQLSCAADVAVSFGAKKQQVFCMEWHLKDWPELHIYGVYTVFLAGNSRNIRSYTVYIWYFWQGIHKIHGHIWCIYTDLANPRHLQ